MVQPPVVPVVHADAPAAGRRPGSPRRAVRPAVERVLMTHREAVLDRQFVLERIADAAIALVTAACTLARLDAQLVAKSARPRRPRGRRALPAHGVPPLRRVVPRSEPQRRPPDAAGGAARLCRVTGIAAVHFERSYTRKEHDRQDGCLGAARSHFFGP